MQTVTISTVLGLLKVKGFQSAPTINSKKFWKSTSRYDFQAVLLMVKGFESTRTYGAYIYKKMLWK